ADMRSSRPWQTTSKGGSGTRSTRRAFSPSAKLWRGRWRHTARRRSTPSRPSRATLPSTSDVDSARPRESWPAESGLPAAAWASPEQNAWVEVPLRVLRAHLPTPPAAALAGPGPFSLADPVAFERLLAEAGFAQSRVQVLDLPYFAGATVQEAARLVLQLGP